MLKNLHGFYFFFSFNAADASCQLISFKSLDLNLLSYNMGEIRCQALQLKSSCFHFTLTSQDPFRPDRDPCQFEGGKIAELKTLAQLNEAIGFLSGPGKNCECNLHIMLLRIMSCELTVLLAFLVKRVSIGLIANPVNVSDTSNLFWSSDRDTPVTIPDEQLYGTIDARKRCVALNNMGGSENFYAYSIRECETMTSLCQTCP